MSRVVTAVVAGQSYLLGADINFNDLGSDPTLGGICNAVRDVRVFRQWRWEMEQPESAASR